MMKQFISLINLILGALKSLFKKVNAQDWGINIEEIDQ